jgi:hypothetical protein
MIYNAFFIFLPPAVAMDWLELLQGEKVFLLFFLIGQREQKTAFRRHWKGKEAFCLPVDIYGRKLL